MPTSEEIRKAIDDPRTPCRPAWCLDDAREFLAQHFSELFTEGRGQVLANLLDDAYLRGRREERGNDSPWPPVDVVRKLVEATEHLLQDHSCDTHGYEEMNCAVEEAKKWLSGGGR